MSESIILQDRQCTFNVIFKRADATFLELENNKYYIF